MHPRKEKIAQSVPISDSKKSPRSEDEIRTLLDPLSKEHLINLLVKFAIEDESIFDEVNRASETDPSRTKLFVRELAWATTSEKLRSVFEIYGEIEEAVVIKDRHTQRSRGFGFVRYKTATSALKALEEPAKEIDGRVTQCNLASKGNPFKQHPSSPTYPTSPVTESGSLVQTWSEPWAPTYDYRLIPRFTTRFPIYATTAPYYNVYNSPRQYDPLPSTSTPTTTSYTTTSTVSTQAPTSTTYSKATFPVSAEQVLASYSLPSSPTKSLSTIGSSYENGTGSLHEGGSLQVHQRQHQLHQATGTTGTTYQISYQ